MYALTCLVSSGRILLVVYYYSGYSKREKLVLYFILKYVLINLLTSTTLVVLYGNQSIGRLRCWLNTAQEGRARDNSHTPERTPQATVAQP